MASTNDMSNIDEAIELIQLILREKYNEALNGETVLMKLER